MLKPNYALDFQPICTFFPWGEGIEDTELQPFLDFSQFCPSSPWERGLRIPNPNHVWDSQLICPFLPRGRELRIRNPNRVWDFQPICLFSPWREEIEDTEPQPCLGFSANLYLLPVREGLRIPNLSHLGISSHFCPLSPWERVRERAVSRRLTFRFRKKSSERSSCQEAAHAENERNKFRQNGTLRPFRKGKYNEIQSNPFIVYCCSLGACRL